MFQADTRASTVGLWSPRFRALSRAFTLVCSLVVGLGVLCSRPGTAQCFFAEDQRLLSDDGRSGDSLGTAVAVTGNYVLTGSPFDDSGGPNSGSVSVFFSDSGDLVEVQEIVPPLNVGAGRFGISLAAENDVLVVGAPGEGASVSFSGVAHVYRLIFGRWVFEQTLESANPGVGDEFGISVSVSGDRILIGANLDDETQPNAGAAYVFAFSGGQWQLEQKLVVPGASPGDQLGFSVSISDDVALVGSPFCNEGVTLGGCVYAFRRAGAVWEFEQALVNPFGQPADSLGFAVSVSGDVALVGSPGTDFIQQGALDVGSALIYRFLLGSWELTDVLLYSDSSPSEGNKFGYSVSLAGNVALVGAPFDDDPLQDAGTASVFLNDGLGWVSQGVLRGSAVTFLHRFGSSLDQDGALFAVGAPLDPAMGAVAGSAYTFSGIFPGAVNGADSLTDVLFINGSAGGSSRTVQVGIGVPISVSLSAPPAGPAPADYVLWVWRDVVVNPFILNVGTSTLGCTVSPTPLQPFASPQPILCLDSGSLPLAGFCGGLRTIRASDSAPFEVTKNAGQPRRSSFLIQGVVEDQGSISIDGYSVTNAVILEVR